MIEDSPLRKLLLIEQTLMKGYDEIIKQQGIFAARMILPENEEITAIKRAKAYVMIKENDAGIPMVKRYSMEWK